MDHRLEFAVIESALEGHPAAEDDIGKRRGIAGANDQLGTCKRCFELFMADIGHGGISQLAGFLQDRKSTRLNSSHVAISYAVFCLKKIRDFCSKTNKN